MFCFSFFCSLLMRAILRVRKKVLLWLSTRYIVYFGLYWNGLRRAVMPQPLKLFPVNRTSIHLRSKNSTPKYWMARPPCLSGHKEFHDLLIVWRRMHRFSSSIALDKPMLIPGRSCVAGPPRLGRLLLYSRLERPPNQSHTLPSQEPVCLTCQYATPNQLDAWASNLSVRTSAF